MKRIFIFAFSLLSLGAFAQENNYPANGFVGLGTAASTPYEKLHVQGGNIFLNSGNLINGIGYNYFYHSGHNLVIASRPGLYTHNTLMLRPGGSTSGALNSTLQMFLTPSPNNYTLRVQLRAEGASFLNGGNVGINTETPAARLEVNGQTMVSGGNNLILKAPDAATDDPGDLFFSGSTGTELARVFVQPNTGELRLSVGSPTSAKMIIAKNGNISIGAVPRDEYKLSVAGTIGARKVKVTSEAWADFVFQPEYKLPTLSEVESYIKMHQHLPEIPSAAEVEKDGIDVGEMNKKLLQKIEEMTLYLIEMKKEIGALKEKNEALEKVVRSGK
ncbi:hypothetical protein SAMN05428949_4988 [Chitinophaga sp. YR627]|uniref:hypothetical protein n=1 Tax=Chitinophaga sp. YR627 TaxID=1881041 RepID=UPI0008E6C8D3|nr:hypothetical protein [Chitinophaga sp. YR627]SFO33436.1 hypothetical protein SAMN05428949_4988 [Chitinophaga sp. YR627]